MNDAAQTPKLSLPGGGGYLGRHLSRYFSSLGWDVTVLWRHASAQLDGVAYLQWDGKQIGTWAATIDGATAVINLAGRSVNCRYTAKNRREIYDSRLDSTRIIGHAIAAAKYPPPLWINASSATIYRHALDHPMDEITGEIGSGFSVDVCRKWEQALADAPTPRTRKVALRSAMVFGPGVGGVFAAFDRIVRLGLGGTMGRGDQFVSWIHVQDFCRAVRWIIEHPELSGPINVSSPNPIPNRQFMKIFRAARSKSVGLPAPRPLLEIGALFLRTETELLLKSRRVVPARLLESGFTFECPQFQNAIGQIVNAPDAGNKSGAASCGLQ